MSVDKKLEEAHLEMLIEAEEKNFMRLSLEVPEMANHIKKDFDGYIDELRKCFESTGIVPSLKDIEARLPNNSYLKVMTSYMRHLAKKNKITEMDLEDMRGSVNKAINQRVKWGKN